MILVIFLPLYLKLYLPWNELILKKAVLSESLIDVKHMLSMPLNSPNY